MKRIVAWLSVSVLFAGICVARAAQFQATGTASQDSSVSASQSETQATSNTAAVASEATTVSDKNKHAQVASAGELQAGSTMQAQLTKPLDARKNKAGDEVMAKTTQDVKSDGHVVIPKGSKLVGHVTEVRAQTKDQAGSALGITFDRALLKSGTSIPISSSIQAIGRAQASAAAAEDDMVTGGAGGSAMGSPSARTAGGGLLNGVGTTASRVVNTANSTTGAAATGAGSVASGSLTSTSQGVVGLRGLSLAADASNSTHGSVITSNGGNVHLDSGTELVLRVNQ